MSDLAGRKNFLDYVPFEDWSLVFACLENGKAIDVPRVRAQVERLKFTIEDLNREWKSRCDYLEERNAKLMSGLADNMENINRYQTAEDEVLHLRQEIERLNFTNDRHFAKMVADHKDALNERDTAKKRIAELEDLLDAAERNRKNRQEIRLDRMVAALACRMAESQRNPNCETDLTVTHLYIPAEKCLPDAIAALRAIDAHQNGEGYIHDEQLEAGYVLAMRLLQSDIVLDDTERAAMEFFVPQKG